MNKNDYIKSRYSAILSETGIVFLIGGIILLSPLLVLFAWPEEKVHASGFIIPSLVLMGIGLILWRLLKPRKPVALTIQEGGIIVVLSWSVVNFFSALPFHSILNIGMTQSIFESVSGWTTTGLSVVDVTVAPRIILIWRSIMQLAGGAGLAIIMLSSLAGHAGAGVSFAEGRDLLVPNVRQSAKMVMGIYTGYAVFGIIAYKLVGMSLWDAINHALPAISTGGFSTYPDSIGHWNSFPIELVSIVLMILGNLNFLTAYTLLHGRGKAFLRNGEIRLFWFLVPVSAAILFFFVCPAHFQSWTKCFRVAIFETVTALTTTGFSTVSYQNWNATGFLILIVLMLVGGGACSTAGGIKQYRIYVLYKSLVWEIRRTLLPRTAVAENYVWQDEWKDFIDDTRIRRIGTFVFLYMVTFVVGSGVIALYGYGLQESFFEFASSLGTVGISVGITSVSAPKAVLWTEIFGMFLGRLEFFVIITSLFKMITDFASLRRS